MDLFGRKAKKLNERALILLQKKDEERAQLRMQLYRLSIQLNQRDKEYAELRNVAVGLYDEIARRDAEANTRPVANTTHLHVSDDDVAELEWLRDNGHIDREGFNQMMNGLGFENTEVDIAPEYATRGDLSY